MADYDNQRRTSKSPGEGRSTKRAPGDMSERKSKRNSEVGMAERNAKRLKKQQMLELERRFLLAAFACGIIASFIYLISFSSEYWVFVDFPTSQFRDERGPNDTYYKKGHYHGLWKICRLEYHNTTDGKEPEDIYYCRKMYFSLPDDNSAQFKRILQFKDAESKILDFRRSTVAVGFIGIILGIVANVFVYFSLDQLRYVFKRLSGCLILITGACCWVTLEVFKQSVYYETGHMKHNIAPDSVIVFGWSYHLVWLALILYAFDGVVLLVCARKRKGVKARSIKEARENEPVFLGRV